MQMLFVYSRHKVSNMQSKLEQLEKRLARNVTLEINIKKTKAMRINNSSTENIMLQDRVVSRIRR